MSGNRLRNALPRGRPLGTAGLVGLAVLIVAAGSLPLASGSSVRVLRAPYHRSVASFSASPYDSGSCPTKSRGDWTGWNATTGGLSSRAVATAGGCASPLLGPGWGEAVAESDVDVAVPVHLSTTQANISVSISYQLTLTSAVHGSFSCPRPHPVPGQATSRSCSFDISAMAWAEFELLDSTNLSAMSGSYSGGHLLFSELYQNNATQCSASGNCTTSGSSGNCSGSSPYAGRCVPSGAPVSGTVTFWLNASHNCYAALFNRCYGWQNWTLVPTHRYWVVVQFTVYAGSNEYSYTKGIDCVARAEPSLANAPGWSLTAITIR
ncbi:MAG TPA: hypothetical protein VGV89_03105 [Thermoplasmata archaeon]|nr:hypothetical protein [Thermoplasmata archaeon]